MRVAVVTWSSRRVGGVEDYVSILLPALRRAGHEVALWHEIDEPGDRVRIQLPEGTPCFSGAAMGAGASLDALRAWKPDVIYNQGLSDPALGMRMSAIAPSVFFLHSYVGTCISGGKTFTRPTTMPCHRRFGWPCLLHYFPHGCGGRSPVTMGRQFVRQSAQLALLRQQTSIVTHSDHMRDEMSRHGLRADVLPYPIEARGTADTHVGSGAWRLLFTGRMDYLKGGLVLLDALPKVLARAGHPLQVTFAGDGPDRAAWEKRAHQVRQDTRDLTIAFTGWIALEEVASLMTKADLLVVPSVWPEPFGSVGPFAGQYGLPAAAFAVGGIPQWLADGVSGHLAPGDPPTADGLAQAIVACLENPLHYAALREGARQMAGKFTMDRHIPALLGTLERASATRARDAG